jgi:hypothetical protein
MLLQQFIQVEKKLFISEKMRKSYKSVRSMANYGTVLRPPHGEQYLKRLIKFVFFLKQDLSTTGQAVL